MEKLATRMNLYHAWKTDQGLGYLGCQFASQGTADLTVKFSYLVLTLEEQCRTKRFHRHLEPRLARQPVKKRLTGTFRRHPHHLLA